MKAALPFKDVFTGPGGRIAPGVLAEHLKVSKAELAAATGLSRDAISKNRRLAAPPTQRRLRELVEIVQRALPWAGSAPQAFAWYRAQSLPSFGDQTAESLVKQGRAEAVRNYLDRIALGGHA